jgi:hypothetical protein
VELDPARVEGLNKQIRHLADLLPGAKDPNHLYGFSCECRCGKIVAMSAADFDRQGGAWAEGHRPAQQQAS